MRRSDPRMRSERGFSLLETLVALAIFALALGQVALSVRSDARAVAAAEITDVIETATRNSRRDGTMRVIRTADTRLTVWRGAEVEHVHQPASGLRLTSTQPIRLSADGGASGGVILLTGDDQTYAIRISRFDGSARVERRPHAKS